MEVWVFRSARFAARCAHGGIYADQHFPVHLGSAKPLPYKAISPTPVDHVADGRVFAIGLASNTHDSQIVQADLAQIADEIAG
jgi:hypothetical protein